MHKSPQETLDEVAKENGYEDFADFIANNHHDLTFYLKGVDKHFLDKKGSKGLIDFLHESMRRYAEQQKISSEEFKQKLSVIISSEVSSGNEKRDAILELCASYSPSWVSDEEINRIAIFTLLKINTPENGKPSEPKKYIVEALEHLRSLIFKEGKTKEQEWISVKQRMPEDYQHVLVMTDEKDIVNAQYCDDVDGMSFTSNSFKKGVFTPITHWMPLPDIPISDKNNQHG